MVKNVNRRCKKKTSKVPMLKSNGIMKKNNCKRASMKKTDVYTKKARLTMRRRTATKSISASRKAGSKSVKNNKLKSRTTLCGKRISMKRPQKKMVSSKKINLKLKKSSKSRSRSSIRHVQKKRMASKRCSVNRMPTKARKSSKSRSRSSIRCVRKKRVASKRRPVNRMPTKARKSSKSRSISSIGRVQKKRVAFS